MSSAVPHAPQLGSWIIIMALDGISTTSPAMAITLAMLPARASIFTVTLAGWLFSRL